MKKIKWTIMTLAILFSIGGAFASRPHPLQTGLFYWNGVGYSAVNGQMGVGWVCVTSGSICTYTKSGVTYTPYQTGSSYTPLQLTTTPDPKPAPKKQ